jgi:hypothetical protein
VLRIALGVCGAVLGSASPSSAQWADVEDNGLCASAQQLADAAVPFDVVGSLAPGDVDFFRFSAAPGQRLFVDHAGVRGSQGALRNPLLGFFDSSCAPLAINDDFGDGLDSHLEIQVPADGVVILAATAFGDDAFAGQHSAVGDYPLSVAVAAFVPSITGRLVAAETGAPLASESAFAGLFRCEDETDPSCSLIDIQPVDAEGRFHFASAEDGSELMPGRYRVLAIEVDREVAETAVVLATSGQTLDFGDIALTAWRVEVEVVQPCVVPARGGTCRYRARIHNLMNQRLNGLAWSSVSKFRKGFLGHRSEFEASVNSGFRSAARANLAVRAAGSQVVEFEFPVPRQPEGVVEVFCPQMHVGLNPAPLMDPIDRGDGLFCVEQGAESQSQVLPAAEAARYLQGDRAL